jgi:endonuclease YncB( thermonuclease family)
LTGPAHAGGAGITPDGTATTCSLEPGPIHTVTRIIDAETVALDDGSEVRLAGAMAPRARDAGAKAGAWPLESRAIDALTALVLGKPVELAYGSEQADRYGRRRAHLFFDSAQSRIWVQGEMLSHGFARAYALPRDGACLAELLAHESLARAAGEGVWSLPLYRAKPSARTGLLMGLRSTFQIVTGKVVSVNRTKSAIYLNFGTDWHDDFSVRIARRAAEADPEWDASRDGLRDQTIEVRGWIERRNGPQIAISHRHELRTGEDAPSAKAVAGKRGMPGETDAARAPADAQPFATQPPAARKEKRPEPKAPGDVDL